jgi:predicted RNA-binding protein with PUA-like domain
MAIQFWLMKSEPDVYSIEDLERQGTGTWEGVRNYQARNHLRSMELGDLAIFYHSSTTPPGAVGIAKVAKKAYPDPFQFDPKSEYYDPKSPKTDPRWSAVDVAFVERFREPVSLERMKGDDALSGMLVLQKGTRLSVTPVEREHFVRLLALAKAKTRVPKSR